MKAQKIYTILAFTGTLFLSVGCNKLVDMKPLNEISDASYWKNADQFKLAANEFYTYLRSFGDILDNNPHSDRRSDIIFTRDGANTFSNGTNTVPNTDGSWSQWLAKPSPHKSEAQMLSKLDEAVNDASKGA